LLLQDVVSASSDGTLLERISKIMGYINQTSGESRRRGGGDGEGGAGRVCCSCIHCCNDGPRA